MPHIAWRYVVPVAAMLAMAGEAAAQTPAQSAGQSAAQASLTAPADVVKTLYDQVIKFCAGEEIAPPYTDKFMRANFEKVVADRYLARLHKSWVDFDIFIDGQDCKLENLVIEALDATATTAVVRARFTNFDQARTVDYDFRNASAGWMIADMAYRHRKFTLRSYLKLGPRT